MKLPLISTEGRCKVQQKGSMVVLIAFLIMSYYESLESQVNPPKPNASPGAANAATTQNNQENSALELWIKATKAEWGNRPDAILNKELGRRGHLPCPAGLDLQCRGLWARSVNHELSSPFSPSTSAIQISEINNRLAKPNPCR